MATTSFNKAFVVTNDDSVKKFKENANNPVKVSANKRDCNSDNAKGLESLRRKLSGCATS